METHARFFLIGLFSLIVTLALILFALWLGKLQLDREYQEYDVLFHESVTGLSVGGLVQYHGIQVGEVRRLSLDANDPREVRVRVRVGAATPIKTDTKAQLSYTGLTGVAVVELFGGTPKAKLLRESTDAAVPEIDTVPSALSELMSGGSGAVHSVQEVMVRIANVLDDDNTRRIATVLDNLATVTSEVKSDYPKLRQAIDDARVLEQRLASAATRADDLLAKVQHELGDGADGSHAIAETRAAIADIREAARALAQFARTGEHAAAGVDEQARTELAAALTSLRETSEQLSRITRRFDAAPADYVLGGDALPTYTPEKQP